MDSILTAAWKETVEQHVEPTLQLLQDFEPKSVSEIRVSMQRIEEGQREARTNWKFLGEIENDLQTYLSNLSLDSLKVILTCL